MTVFNAGPTPSQTSNELLQLAEAVVAGTASTEALATSIAAHAARLEQASRDFDTQVAQLRLTGTAAVKASVDEVHGSFADYRKSIESLLRVSNAESLRSATTLLTRATMRVLNALASYDLQELLAIGPTQNPFVNLLLRLAKRLEAGSITAASYLAAVEQAVSRMMQGIAPILERFEKEQAPQLSALREAEAERSAAVEAFIQFAERRDQEALEQAADRLMGAFSTFNTALQHSGMSRLAAGPSRSPHVNILRNALEGFAQKMLPEFAWHDAVVGFTEAMRRTHLEIDAVASAAHTPALHEDLKSLQAAVAQMDAFVQELTLCRDNRTAMTLLERFGAFSATVDQVLDTFDNVRKLLEQAGKVVCVRCHHYNPAGASTCERCHARLPRFGGDSPSSLLGVKEGGAAPLQCMPLPAPLQRLFTAVNQIAEDAISVEDFLIVVDQTSRQIDDNEQSAETQAATKYAQINEALHDEAQRDAATVALTQSLHAIRDGSAVVRDGLERMRVFVHDQDRDKLEEAVRGVYRGFCQLHEVHEASERPLVEAHTAHIVLEAPLVSVKQADYSLTLSAETDEEEPEESSPLIRSLLNEHAKDDSPGRS